MNKLLFLILTMISLTSCSQRYYIVRHAEKMRPDSATKTMVTTDNPPLSIAGEQRAEELKKVLKKKKITVIYSTNTERTLATAQPFAADNKILIHTYSGVDSSFINELKQLSTNVLVVGHSNTVDEIVNGLVGKHVLSDLADSAYNNLFIVKKKHGKYSFSNKHYGK
jgi:phosphohistidine phosphatase SixA